MPRCWSGGDSNCRSHPTKSLVSRRIGTDLRHPQTLSCGGAPLAVRSASLVERRGFESPVLFALLIFREGTYRRRLELNAIIPRKQHREVFSDAIHRHGRAENERISNGLLGAKDQKGTGSSNPLRSTNEALRTAGLVHATSRGSNMRMVVKRTGVVGI